MFAFFDGYIYEGKNNKEEKMNISHLQCTNDVVFKHLLVRQPTLIKEIIYGLTGIQCKELHIQNPNILPNHEDEKSVSLDVFAIDEHGYLYDIEMQNSTINPSLIFRAQYHISRLLSLQEKLGGVYSLKPVYCIFLINAGTNYDTLYKKYLLRNLNGTMPNNLVHIIFVFFPYINQLIKGIPLSQLNTFKRIFYAFHYNLNRDILELEDEVIKTMAENRIEFLANGGNLLTEAERIWLNKMEQLEKERERIELEAKTAQLKEQFALLSEESEQLKEKSAQLKEESAQFKQETAKLKTEVSKTKSEVKKAKLIIENHIQIIMRKLNLNYDEACAFLKGN